ncbi:hypothetical protein H0H81_010410 [Sphagnurus paluster]|uniref:F-box domain-containing protein n=1 Tax=Sphagnurus paluster TaxID=117069 RepID=A0A9P7KIJ6_9AGAR|nr:hypothetical protein H0H81_010410 [Sphagnurus paluster]
MHYALTIPELLQKIFWELGLQAASTPHPDLDSWSQEGIQPHYGKSVVGEHSGRRALARAARCCKAFCDPALDELWSVQLSLVPLLSILPGFMTEETGRYASYTHRGNISTPDWLRLQTYAERIRILEIWEPDMIRWEFLDGRQLVPRLHTLAYPLHDSMRMLVSPALRRIHIQRFYSADGVHEFLEDFLLKKAPSLESLSSAFGPVFSKLSLGVLAKFEHLQHLTVAEDAVISIRQLNEPGAPSTVFDGLEEILSLPLDKLHLHIPFARRSLTFSALGTRSLRVLMLTSRPRIIDAVLELLAHSPLEVLRLGYIHPAGPGKGTAAGIWDKRFARAAQWSKSMTVLEMKEYRSSELRDDSDLDESVHGDCEPLLQMANLRSLALTAGYTTFDFSDAYFLKMAQAWPQMEALSIKSWRIAQRPSATFGALNAFAAYCPALHSLDLSLCLSRIRTSPSAPTPHRLENLYIGYPIYGDPQRVAQCLYAWFPFVRVKGSDEELPRNNAFTGMPVVHENLGRKTSWVRVSDALELLQSVQLCNRS